MPTTTKLIVRVELSERYKLDAEPATFGVWGTNGFGGTIDPSQETFVLTHGFLNSGEPPDAWLTSMANSIRAQHPNANIVISHWETTSGLSVLGYPLVSARVGATARELATFLETNNVNPNSLTMIGFSLGAHVSGLAGQYMSGSPKLIIGLDPAGPIYEALPSNMRLSPSDAQRVVALHTSRTFGYDFPIGHLDIFVNPNSIFQPGANNAIDNHGYAHILFTELVSGANYGGLNWQALNDPTQRGIYSANTTGAGGQIAPMSPIENPALLNIQSLWNWLEQQMQYQNAATGELVTPQQEQSVSQSLSQQSASELYRVAAQLQAGEISISEWQKRTAEILKNLHIQQAVLARGGADRMTAENWLNIVHVLKEEYRFLRQLAQDLLAGNITPAMLRFRLSMYANRSRRSFEAMELQNMKDAGYKYMERTLAFHDRHCKECIDYAMAGRQPIGTLPLPTEECTCRANCTCDVRYFKESSG